MLYWIQKFRMLGTHSEIQKTSASSRKSHSYSEICTTYHQGTGQVIFWDVEFYRKFIPNFSVFAAPLTDLTKKGQPNKVIWKEQQEDAFVSLKYALMVTPVLKLPDVNEPFIL